MTMNDYGQLALFIGGLFALGMVLNTVSEMVYWKVYDWYLSRKSKETEED